MKKIKLSDLVIMSMTNSMCEALAFMAIASWSVWNVKTFLIKV